MKENTKKISVVIAAHNEEPRINIILDAIYEHPLIDEVIVVDDGSTDNTAQKVKKYNKVKLIINKTNIGKTLSVKKGVESAKNTLIMLLDADFTVIDPDFITKLAKPVLDGRVDFTLAILAKALLLSRVIKVEWLSGQRVLLKTDLLDPWIWAKPKVGYSLEARTNQSLLNKGRTFCSVESYDTHVMTKSKKRGIKTGIIQEFRMCVNMFQALPFNKFVWQVAKMAFLNWRYMKSIHKDTTK